MKLVEKHIINSEDPLYKEIDDLALKSKNLYNVCTYVIRQNHFNNIKSSGITNIIASDGKFNYSADYVYDLITNSGGCCQLKYLNNIYLDKMLNRKSQVDYRALPAKVSHQVLKQVHQDWTSYFSALNDYKITPGKYTGCPRIPGYKEKIEGRNKVVYEKGSISRIGLKQGLIQLSMTNISIPFINKGERLCCVEITKNNLSYTISIIYEKTAKPAVINNRLISIDLGINNLMTIVFNVKERPVIINGKPIKAINQYYNKKLARLKSELPYGVYTSNQIKKFTDKRNWKIECELHKASKKVLEICEIHNISRVVVGYNPGWKQDCNLGKKTNQNFVQIPFLKLISQLRYKLALNGIELILIGESYTSKCSALDNEKIGFHDVYLGKRIKRGLFQTKDGFLVNADVNAAYNILRKVVPEFKVGNRGFAVNPVKVTL